MKKVTIIYWSGTGNTEKMANAIADGVRNTENAVEVLSVENASVDLVKQSDLLAFGCPSMGDEVLEDSVMEPFIKSLENIDLSKKTVFLFGSYDWGDGEWMRNWENRMKDYGANLLGNGLIVNLEPGDEELEKCKSAGEKLAKA